MIKFFSMKKFFLCAWLLGAVSYTSSAQQSVHVSSYTVTPKSIRENGVLSQKIYLKNNATPLVKIKNIQTARIDRLPDNMRSSNSFEPDVFISMERKKPVVFVTIPAYRSTSGNIEKLISYDLEITEQELPQDAVAQKPTGASNSVLATGSWYKIATPSRGVYKIDYAFLQSIGVNPATINPANIRVYGNGGTVLPETANSNQPDDLIENAITVSSSGSTFGPTDYILFYANGPLLWEPDAINKTFTHVSNYYENRSYYFLNFDLGPGKRINSEPANGAASFAVSAFDDYALVDNDSFNVGGIGKVWWSNKMNPVNSATLTQNITVNLGAVTDSMKISTVVGNVNIQSGNQVQLRYNNGPVTSLSLPVPGSYSLIDTRPATLLVPPPANGPSTLQFKYIPNGNGVGYIDYVRFNYRRQPLFPGGQFAFRDWKTTTLAAGENASYTLQNAPSTLQVWDITNNLAPVQLQGTTGANTYTFSREGNSLKEFIAFDGSQYLTPVALAGNPIPNQNLHALEQTDLLIVTSPAFKPAAEELAEYHRQRDQMKVTIALIGDIYNEFSSGSQDIGGIRNFIKMFYDRGSGNDLIKNVLFLGAASYDYKDRLSSNTNFVPTYQSYESTLSTYAYASDDFFALLDDGENMDNVNSLADIGTGRIPAETPEEAHNAVTKIKMYTSPASFGPWKNVVSYVADDMDDDGSMDHMNDCEQVNNFFPDSFKNLNLYKIYADAYAEVSTPGGGRYPMVNKAIDDQIYTGTLFMSYSGHGSPERWAHEAILTSDDYGNWKNKYKLPVMVTATCDFGRFDDPEHRSAGAKLMMNPAAGSIAMITTTQVVFSTQNTDLNEDYTTAQFTRDASGQWRTLGEALARAKNTYKSLNNRRYVVLGDPALKIGIPEFTVRTDELKINDNGNIYATDTIKALGRYTLSGSVTDNSNNVLSNFNGPVYVTIYDKTRRVQTVNPTRVAKEAVTSFKVQTNIVARVKGTVKNGAFSVDFIVPKDINYDYGFGKVSYYANSDVSDASGVDTGMTVGGFNQNAPDDNTPPVVLPYIDNDKFRNGGVTGPNPLLFVKLYDDNGINVSGSSIGHDLVAILDNDEQNPFIMNNYYESEQNNYQKGTVSFPMYNLPEGVHTLRVKAWDVYNNSGEGTVTFEVKNKDKGFISDLYNYPNPVTDMTHIVFQHNQEGEQMDVTVQLFNASGALMRTLKQNMEATGNRTEITWDGLGEGGARLAKGVYFYRLVAKTSKGISATAYQKLVLLR